MRALLLIADWLLGGVGIVVLTNVYPGFHHVGESEWAKFHELHTRRIAWAVAIPWAFQGAASAWWILNSGYDATSLVHGFLAALAVIATVVGAVPRHAAITGKYQRTEVRRLEAWHALRTALWLVAACVATYGA